MWDAVMHRYGIKSYDELLSTWSRAQLYLANDAIFWSQPKRTDDYGPPPRFIDPKAVRAADFFRAFGF
jgi:hypothetical protein